MQRQMTQWTILVTSATSALAAGVFTQASLATAINSNPQIPLPSAVQYSQAADPIRPVTDCPADLETLTTMLLRDLPSYANRVSQRARNRARSLDVFGYVLLAGRPEFDPLSLGPGEYTPSLTEDDPEQVFFTTLERQYITGEAVQFQHYHWLFLTQSESDWRFVLMLSRIGSPPNEPPSPPTDSSQGVIGRAIQLWLRDCRSGDVQAL